MLYSIKALMGANFVFLFNTVKKIKKKIKKELTKGSKFDIISKPTVAGGHGGRGKAP